MTHYIDTDPEIPDRLGRVCEMCDYDEDLILGPIHRDLEDGYRTGTRCRDGVACRSRHQPTEGAPDED